LGEIANTITAVELKTHNPTFASREEHASNITFATAQHLVTLESIVNSPFARTSAQIMRMCAMDMDFVLLQTRAPIAKEVTRERPVS